MFSGQPRRRQSCIERYELRALIPQVRFLQGTEGDRALGGTADKRTRQ